MSFLLPLYIHEKINSSESARLTILPEPERFFGGKRVLYGTPPPHLQHLAEGLPELWSEVWWIGICNDLGTVPGVSIKRLCKRILVQMTRYTWNTNRYNSKASGQDGIFFKGTQAWDNFEFFLDLNQILICPSYIFEKNFASFPSIFARISMFEHFRGDWAYAEPNFFWEISKNFFSSNPSLWFY